MAKMVALINILVHPDYHSLLDTKMENQRNSSPIRPLLYTQTFIATADAF